MPVTCLVAFEDIAAVMRCKGKSDSAHHSGLLHPRPVQHQARRLTQLHKEPRYTVISRMAQVTPASFIIFAPDSLPFFSVASTAAVPLRPGNRTTNTGLLHEDAAS